MSDKELPEIEPGKAPLIVFAILGLGVLFFVGLLAAVLFRGEGERPVPESNADSDLKEPDALLGPDETFRVRFETSVGPFVVEVNPAWAPRGATQFRELVEAGFYDGCRFFRVMPNFVAQFGINGDPEEHQRWRQPIPDDPVVQSNTKGTMTFAMSGPDSRTTQLFINLADNSGSLDPQDFSPFGEVVEGMENVEKINAEYGEQPQQGRIEAEGNEYLNKEFPRLDYIESARIVE